MIEETQAPTGVEIERACVDTGYRGHTAPKTRGVFLSGQKRDAFGAIKRDLQGRSAIKGIVGHMKTDGHLDRNFLKGRAGDHANAVLTATGDTLRLILKWLRTLLAQMLIAIFVGLRPKPAPNPAC